MLSTLSAILRRLFAVMLLVMPLAAAHGETEGADQPAGTETRPPAGSLVKTTGLPIPRFVSLRSGKVNLRTGPGVRYPVEWVFVRRRMPVEITAEFDTWRRIRDWQGSEGWVHQSMLSGARTALVVGEIRPLRSAPRPDAPILARAEPGVIAGIEACAADWCDVEVNGYRGWVPKDDIWGVYEHERID